mmetsp:Transcript_34926/g.112592  ORF Transcript_34926/g.112592 Transcript_34926/m.112592 type:complete len:281 (-) Transcript_34926:803-1645(-)
MTAPPAVSARVHPAGVVEPLAGSEGMPSRSASSLSSLSFSASISRSISWSAGEEETMLCVLRSVKTEASLSTLVSSPPSRCAGSSEAPGRACATPLRARAQLAREGVSLAFGLRAALACCSIEPVSSLSATWTRTRRHFQQKRRQGRTQSLQATRKRAVGSTPKKKRAKRRASPGGALRWPSAMSPNESSQCTFIDSSLMRKKWRADLHSTPTFSTAACAACCATALTVSAGASSQSTGGGGGGGGPMANVSKDAASPPPCSISRQVEKREQRRVSALYE